MQLLKSLSQESHEDLSPYKYLGEVVGLCISHGRSPADSA